MIYLGLVCTIISICLLFYGFRHMARVAPQPYKNFKYMPCMYCGTGQMTEVAKLTQDISRYRCEGCGTEIIL